MQTCPCHIYIYISVDIYDIWFISIPYCQFNHSWFYEVLLYIGWHFFTHCEFHPRTIFYYLIFIFALVFLLVLNHGCYQRIFITKVYSLYRNQNINIRIRHQIWTASLFTQSRAISMETVRPVYWGSHTFLIHHIEKRSTTETVFSHSLSLTYVVS